MEKVKVSLLLSNPNNPRVIKDDKFKKLVNSIKEFPEMLEARPVVVNPDMVVLGGNMRLKALREAGVKEVPVYIASWDEVKQKRFIITDNVGYGEWDWDILANEWDAEELGLWGLDVWQPEEDLFGGFDEEEPTKPTPSLSDDDHSLFELLMLHENKIKLISILSQIKEKNYIEKQEDALMHLVLNYN